MVYQRKDPCGWESKSQVPDIEELHDILKCASAQGCRRCVGCSEKALEILNERIKSFNLGGAPDLLPTH